jgi:DNA-binding transcriptional MerR regulator
MGAALDCASSTLDIQVGFKVYACTVTATYTIKDIAARSGFSTATVRYYEEIGLLPQSARTPSGYRTFDDRTVERLAFIARAKRLGCSLEEISELLVAWDGGMCGPVQEKLRSLVASKIAGAQQQILELIALTSDLRTAEAALERHRPEGPCDDSCGCTTEPTTVVLGRAPVAEAPIACTLDATMLPGRLDDWHTMLGHVVQREAIDGGVRVELDGSTPIAELARLVDAEHGCCQFFDFAITVDSRGLGLEIRSQDDALPLVHSLFGA